jgi:hypothetical protein
MSEQYQGQTPPSSILLPKELPRVADPVGPANDEHIVWACQAQLMSTVVAGWGSNKFADKRALKVKHLIRSAGRRDVHCFRRSESGSPWHPLYLPHSSQLVSL